MIIKINKDRTVEKKYEGNEGSQNENRITELDFVLPEEYSDFVSKIVFITEDGNFSDDIENGKYLLKNNITKYQKVLCFVWLTEEETEKDFRSETFPLSFYKNENINSEMPLENEIV